MQVQGSTSKSEPPPASDRDAAHEELRESYKADRLIYARELARWLSAIGSRRWSTRDARRLLSRKAREADPLGFQLGERGPWCTTWGALLETYPRLAARLLTHVAGDGECPVCGRGGEDELD